MFFQTKLDLARYQRLLEPGSTALCRLHDDIDVSVRILSIVHRHHTSGVRVTLYLTEQLDASNVILASLSPLKEIQDRLVALMVIPYQLVDKERRTRYRGDGVFLGSKPLAVHTVLERLESANPDDDLPRHRTGVPTLEAMCCGMARCSCSPI